MVKAKSGLGGISRQWNILDAAASRGASLLAIAPSPNALLPPAHWADPLRKFLETLHLLPE
jgi:hypothetical protein